MLRDEHRSAVHVYLLYNVIVKVSIIMAHVMASPFARQIILLIFNSGNQKFTLRYYMSFVT